MVRRLSTDLGVTNFAVKEKVVIYRDYIISQLYRHYIISQLYRHYIISQLYRHYIVSQLQYIGIIISELYRESNYDDYLLDLGDKPIHLSTAEN